MDKNIVLTLSVVSILMAASLGVAWYLSNDEEENNDNKEKGITGIFSYEAYGKDDDGNVYLGTWDIELNDGRIISSNKSITKYTVDEQSANNDGEFTFKIFKAKSLGVYDFGFIPGPVFDYNSITERNKNDMYKGGSVGMIKTVDTEYGPKELRTFTKTVTEDGKSVHYVYFTDIEGKVYRFESNVNGIKIVYLLK